MAISIPEIPKECGYGERQVFEKLGRDLDSEWIVLHSLGLHGHETKIWGEADIVVLSTKGIYALEVKGGQVSCHDGVWHYGDVDGKHYTKKEDPWTQSKGTMFAIKKLLEEKDDVFRNLLFGYGVVMPMETFTTQGAEIELAVLLDKPDFRTKNLGFYIGNLQRHWTAEYTKKYGKSPNLPTRTDIKRARAILRPNVESVFSIGSYLNGVDQQLLQLSNDQIRASRRMASNPRTIVRGKAGTGKTIIAAERAKQLSEKGKKVLFLCYNQLLAQHVERALANDPRATNVSVRHVHALYREVISRAGMLDRLNNSAALNDSDLYGNVFPEVFIDAALQSGMEQWDALVIDEAQDLLTLNNLDAFDLMLEPGLNHGNWHIFFDPLQNIYGVDVQNAVEKRFAEAQPAFDDLFENCRNTSQVATQASIISGIDLATEGAPNGQPCDNVYYTDQRSFVTLFSNLVKHLLTHDVSAEDIVILSTRKQENSMLSGLNNIGGIPLVDVREANRHSLAFSTMHGFKGLERKVVLAIDMDHVGLEEWAMLHYAGLSRARTLLKAFLPESARGIYDKQVAAFIMRKVKA